jgi:hypothetical protein
MQPSLARHDATAAPPTRTPIPRFVGWLLVAPAALLFLLFHVWPTIELFGTSITGAGAGRGWGFVFSSVYFEEFSYALSYALPPILVIATVAPALAWAASRAGLAGRWALRACLALPLAAFAPVGLALVWTARHRPEEDSPTSIGPTFANWDGRVVMLATMGAFVLAVAVVCYLAALRRREAGTRGWTAAIVVGALLGIVALGVALQQYTFVALVQRSPMNGSSNFKWTPITQLELPAADGRQAAVAAAVPVVLAVLGVAATLLVLRSGLRVEFDPDLRSADDTGASAASRTVALVGTVAGIVGLLVLTVFQLGPWLAELATGEARPPARFPASSVFTSTWLIPLGTALVQVIVAAVAAFGIAVVRPLGQRSEWLLLAFAPWLFIGNPLLQLPRLDPGGNDGVQPLIAYAPPSWVSVPALFVFTLLLRGQAGEWRRSRAAGRPGAFPHAMWPVLPMVVLAAGVVWLMQAQDLLLPTMTDGGGGVVPNAQLLMARGSRLPVSTPQPALGYPLLMLVFLTLGALALQWAYLDRIAVRVGRSTEDAGPP